MIFFLHLLKSCSSIEIWQERTGIFKKSSGWPFFRQCWAVFIHEFRTFSVKLGQEIFHSYPIHFRHACITGNTLQALSEGASWTGWEEAGTHDGDSLAVNALEKYLYQRACRLKEQPISDLESGGRLSHCASFKFRAAMHLWKLLNTINALQSPDCPKFELWRQTVLHKLGMGFLNLLHTSERGFLHRNV